MECCECNKKITSLAAEYCQKHYSGHFLCAKCQSQLSVKLKAKKTTPQTLKLYFFLKKIGLRPTLEYFDGFKTIDIFLADKKLAIEIDGHYHFQPKQALTDLQRDLYSLRQGINTIRIPNALIDEKLEETANAIKTKTL